MKTSLGIVIDLEPTTGIQGRIAVGVDPVDHSRSIKAWDLVHIKIKTILEEALELSKIEPKTLDKFINEMVLPD